MSLPDLSLISKSLETIAEELTALRKLQDRKELRETEYHNNLKKLQSPEAEDEVQVTYEKMNQGVLNRLDEIFGGGISVEEMIKRRQEYDEQNSQ